MKRLLYFILSIALVGCYNDDAAQRELSEDSSHRTSELTRLIKAMSLHNARFDDAIDNTSCFSLIFPYQVQINSELRTINSIQDISALNNEDEIDIVYPVNAVFYNYEEHKINSTTEFNLVKNTCDQNFNIQTNLCLDFQYPITFKEFNDLTRSFETFQLNSDKDVFLHLENLHDNDVFEIDYPIFLSDSNSGSIRIDSNAEFISAFNLSLQDCR
ncbi:hypothetical protein [Flavobacteriaceae bacterium 14752]|uniref:hypothetical protein n=1 Tax=Mesohalobacter salilacus TaxID=2491711 RepID=UPI000F644CCC|nr:hypothetical protein EIG84_06055 [Flavobacteriaceae bacterium 14752]